MRWPSVSPGHQQMATDTETLLIEVEGLSWETGLESPVAPT